MTSTVSKPGFTNIGCLIDYVTFLSGGASSDDDYCSSEEFLQFINSGGGGAPELNKPKRKLTHEQMMVMLSLLVDSSAAKQDRQAETEISQANLAVENQSNALVAENNETMALQEKLARASWIQKTLHKLVKFIRVAQAAPCLCPVIEGIMRAVKMRQMPGLGQMAGGGLLLTMAAMPIIDLALSAEGEGRTIEDLLGGQEWAVALLSLDAGTLLKMGVEQTDGADAATISAMVAGTLLMTCVMAAGSSAAMKGSGGDDKALSTLKLLMGMTSMAEGVCTMGQGMQQLELSEIQQDISNSSADMQLIDIEKRRIEERIQRNLKLLPEFNQLSQTIFKNAAESLENYFDSLSSRINALKRSTAMA